MNDFFDENNGILSKVLVIVYTLAKRTIYVSKEYN